jgi:hypothetical protein
VVHYMKSENHFAEHRNLGSSSIVDELVNMTLEGQLLVLVGLRDKAHQNLAVYLNLGLWDIVGRIAGAHTLRIALDYSDLGADIVI